MSFRHVDRPSDRYVLGENWFPFSRCGGEWRVGDLVNVPFGDDVFRARVTHAGTLGASVEFVGVLTDNNHTVDTDAELVGLAVNVPTEMLSLVMGS